MKKIPLKLLIYSSVLLILFFTTGCPEQQECNDPLNVKLLTPGSNEQIKTGDTIAVIVSTKFYAELSSINIYLLKDRSDTPSDANKLAYIDPRNGSGLYEWHWNTSDIPLGNWLMCVIAENICNDISRDETFINIITSTPTIQTLEVTEITDSTAESGGTIIYNGALPIIKRGIIWNRVTELAPDLENYDGKTDNGSGTGTFTSHLSHLKLGTEYYVRAYAINNDGKIYGNLLRFETKKSSEKPAVSVNDAGDITAHTAIAGGIITDDGGDQGNITAGFVWSETPDPTVDNNDGIYTVPEKLSKDMTFIAYLSSLKENTTYYAKPYASNIAGTVYGEELEIETGSFQIQSGTFTDTRDGKQYRTVTIYSQTWMAENLAYLPEICPHNENCGYWVYGYDGTNVNEAKATDNYAAYGVLYTWARAGSVCPEGWHLPTSDEWSTLEMYLGMDYVTAHKTNSINPRGNNEGGMLKENGTAHWQEPNTGASNIAGFFAVAGGRKITGFSQLTYYSYFWTNTTSGDGYSKMIKFRYLKHDSEKIFAYEDRYNDNTSGYSVRCVKD